VVSYKRYFYEFIINRFYILKVLFLKKIGTFEDKDTNELQGKVSSGMSNPSNSSFFSLGNNNGTNRNQEKIVHQNPRK